MMWKLQIIILVPVTFINITYIHTLAIQRSVMSWCSIALAKK